MIKNRLQKLKLAVKDAISQITFLEEEL